MARRRVSEGKKVKPCEHVMHGIEHQLIPHLWRIIPAVMKGNETRERVRRLCEPG